MAARQGVNVGPCAALRHGVNPAFCGWSGTFNNFAANTTALLSWLGANGTITPDIGDVSHLYNTNTLQGLSPDDEGTAASTPFTDMADANGSVVTDPAYANGTRNLIRYSNHLLPGATSGGGSFDFPVPMDGTRSFLIGLVMQIDAVSGADLNANILQLITVAPLRGWYISTGPSFQSQVAAVMFDTVGTQSAGSPADIVHGEPTLILVNFDFAAGLIKIILPTGMLTGALADRGDFDTGVVLKLGDPGIANWDGAEMTWAQIFMFDYDAALDAQIGPANMTRFLQFADGILT